MTEIGKYRFIGPVGRTRVQKVADCGSVDGLLG
jgi:hypothetical protein